MRVTLSAAREQDTSQKQGLGHELVFDLGLT